MKKHNLLDIVPVRAFIEISITTKWYLRKFVQNIQNTLLKETDIADEK